MTIRERGEALRAAWLGGPRPASVDPDDLLLPSPPGLVRRFWLRHALLADLLIAAFALMTGYFESVDKGRGLQGADWFVHGWIPLIVLSAAALIVRRTRPLLCLAIVSLSSAVLTAAVDSSLGVSIVVAVYSVAIYGGALQAWVGGAVAYGTYLAAAVAFGRFPERNSLLLVGILMALLLGVNLGARRRYLDALIDRAAQLTRERDQQTQLATAAERSRIAREMHDVVAHSLSVMVRLSDGADAIAESDPERSREAVRQIGGVGRDALRDMRRLLGVLREEDGAGDSLEPQPDLADLEHLIETYRTAGLPVAVQAVGTPPAESAVQLVVYRGVQEALTNALRYSKEPSRVLVRLDFTHDVVVEVTDDGFLSTPAPSVGSNRGLVGLRERAALFGGTVEAGPRTADGRGWRLTMTLPGPTERDR